MLESEASLISLFLSKFRFTFLESAMCLLEISFAQGTKTGGEMLTKGCEVQKAGAKVSKKISSGLHSLVCVCIYIAY